MKKARQHERRSPASPTPASAGAGSASAASTAASLVPRVGSYSAPAAFFVVLAVLAYLGHAELGYNHGLFADGVYEPYTDLRGIPKIGGPSRVDAGRDVYTTAGCVACHQPGGTGNPANGCPPLVKSDWVLAEGPSRLIRIILHGAQGAITVSGKTWNGAGMPGLGAGLTDEAIANVLTYIRQSPDWGNDAGEVTPEMVKAIRDKTASRAVQWTPEELLKLPVTE